MPGNESSNSRRLKHHWGKSSWPCPHTSQTLEGWLFQLQQPCEWTSRVLQQQDILMQDPQGLLIRVSLRDSQTKLGCDPVEIKSYSKLQRKLIIIKVNKLYLYFQLVHVLAVGTNNICSKLFFGKGRMYKNKLVLKYIM